MEAVTWLGLAGAVFAAATAGATFLVVYFGNATRLMKRVDELTTRVFALQDESAACRAREGDLKAETVAMNARLRLLESANGRVPAAPLAGIVIADLKGVIREWSPALSPILNYLPEEMIGKSIEACIPPDVLEQHRPGFARAVAMPEGIDPLREIPTYALAKGGVRTPVWIRLHGWKAGSEGFITATIRQRARGQQEAQTPAEVKP